MQPSKPGEVLLKRASSQKKACESVQMLQLISMPKNEQARTGEREREREREREIKRCTNDTKEGRLVRPQTQLHKPRKRKKERN